MWKRVATWTFWNVSWTQSKTNVDERKDRLTIRLSEPLHYGMCVLCISKAAETKEASVLPVTPGPPRRPSGEGVHLEHTRPRLKSASVEPYKSSADTPVASLPDTTSSA